MRPDIAGWSSLVARRAHNPEVVGSNPAPATKKLQLVGYAGELFCCFPTMSRLFSDCKLRGRHQEGRSRHPDLGVKGPRTRVGKCVITAVRKHALTLLHKHALTHLCKSVRACLRMVKRGSPDSKINHVVTGHAILRSFPSRHYRWSCPPFSSSLVGSIPSWPFEHR